MAPSCSRCAMMTRPIPSGNNLVIRATAADENRKAVITVAGVSAKITVYQAKYTINDEYWDGIYLTRVFDIQDGVMKIIQNASVGDKRAFAWSTENVQVLPNQDWYDGEINQKAIMKIPDWENLYPAFKAVHDLNREDSKGWYLPATEELFLRNKTSNINSNWYWTSNEISANEALHMYPSNSRWGDKDNVDKSNEYYVCGLKKIKLDYK